VVTFECRMFDRSGQIAMISMMPIIGKRP
jgi:hypothetical protein